MTTTSFSAPCSETGLLTALCVLVVRLPPVVYLMRTRTRWRKGRSTTESTGARSAALEVIVRGRAAAPPPSSPLLLCKLEVKLFNPRAAACFLIFTSKFKSSKGGLCRRNRPTVQ